MSTVLRRDTLSSEMLNSGERCYVITHAMGVFYRESATTFRCFSLVVRCIHVELIAYFPMILEWHSTRIRLNS